MANICIGYFDNKLQIKLPSGRILYYVNPGKIMNKFGQINLAYDGVGQNKKWSRIPTYGPKLVENIIQGICRDILADAMLRVEKAGFDTCMMKSSARFQTGSPAWKRSAPLCRSCLIGQTVRFR